MTAHRCPTCGNSLQTWPKPAIVAALQRWMAAHDGRPPVTRDWQNATPGWPDAATVRTKFGSWQAALEAAGVESLVYRKWDRDQIVQAIFQWVHDHGRVPRYNEWKKACPNRTRPAASTVRAIFGTWAEAIRAAGYRPYRDSHVRQRHHLTGGMAV